MGIAIRMKLPLIVSFLCYLPLTLGKTVGSIQVEGVGEIFLLAPDWATVETLDNGFSLKGNGKLYFGTTADDSFTADSFWQTPLADKHFSYTVDLSNVVWVQCWWIFCEHAW